MKTRAILRGELLRLLLLCCNGRTNQEERFYPFLPAVHASCYFLHASDWNLFWNQVNICSGRDSKGIFYLHKKNLGFAYFQSGVDIVHCNMENELILSWTTKQLAIFVETELCNFAMQRDEGWNTIICYGCYDWRSYRGHFFPSLYERAMFCMTVQYFDAACNGKTPLYLRPSKQRDENLGIDCGTQYPSWIRGLTSFIPVARVCWRVRHHTQGNGLRWKCRNTLVIVDVPPRWLYVPPRCNFMESPRTQQFTIWLHARLNWQAS